MVLLCISLIFICLLVRNIQKQGKKHPFTSCDLVFLGNKIWRFRPRSCPVIVEGCVKHWPAMHWSRDTLLSRFGAVPFAAGAADFPLELWYDYAQSNTDDVAGLQNTCAAVGCITLGAGNGWNMWTITSSGWWFGTLVIFHDIGGSQ